MAKAAKEKDPAAAKPKKEKAAKVEKAEKKDDTSVQQVILAYLVKQNRPYSPIDVFNNLGGTIPKTQVAKIMATLFAEGQIHAKCNAKAWVYLCKQDDLECPSQADLDALDERIKELTESISATKDSNKTTSQLLSSTCALPTDAQLAALLPQSQSAAAVAKEHLATLQSGQKELITPEQMKMLVAEIEKVAVLGRKRRGACLDMMDMVCEMANLKKAELVENAGLTL